MTFRDVYKKEMDLIKADEAVVDNILLKMRKEAQTPASFIKRIPASRFAAAAAGICILAAAAVIIPVVLRSAPSLQNNENAEIPATAIESRDFAGGNAYFEDDAEEADFGIISDMAYDDSLPAPAGVSEAEMWAAADSDEGTVRGGFDEPAGEAPLTNAAAPEAEFSEDLLPADIVSTEPVFPQSSFPVETVLFGYKFDFAALTEIINESETISDILDSIYEIYTGPFMFVETPIPSTVLRIDDTGELVVLVDTSGEKILLYNTAYGTFEVLFGADEIYTYNTNDYYPGNARISGRAWITDAYGGSTAVIENWHHGESIYHDPDMQSMSVSGIPLLPQDFVNIRVPPTIYREGFRIEFAEPPSGSINYVLYDMNLNQLSPAPDSFMFALWSDFKPPTQSGYYYLVLDTSWTTENDEGVFWNVYQLFVLLEIP